MEKCEECGKLTDKQELEDCLGICIDCECKDPIDIAGYDEI